MTALKFQAFFFTQKFSCLIDLANPYVQGFIMNKFISSLFVLSLPLWLSADENPQLKTREQEIKEILDKVKDVPGAVTFVPPEGWVPVDSKELTGNIKIKYIGKGNGSIAPAITLMVKPFSGTLKDYLKKVKAINDSHGDEWKDLGLIKTDAGKGSLSQLDMKTQWGYIRIMHLILIKDGNVYVLTASAPKEEFGRFYAQFFTALRSLKINAS